MVAQLEELGAKVKAKDTGEEEWNKSNGELSIMRLYQLKTHYLRWYRSSRKRTGYRLKILRLNEAIAERDRWVLRKPSLWLVSDC